MTLYMAVTPDRYELPIAVGDTLTELSFLTGVKSGNISSMICHKTSGKTSGMKFVRVEIRERRAKA